MRRRVVAGSWQGSSGPAAELDRQDRRGRGVEIEPAPLARHVGTGQELLQQRARLGVAEAADGIAVQPLDQRGRRRLPVHDRGPEGVGMEHQPHGVRGAQRGHRRGVDEVGLHARGALVDLQDVPVAVEHQRRVRLLLVQDEVERPAYLGHRRRLEIRAAVDGRVAGGDEQVVRSRSGTSSVRASRRTISRLGSQDITSEVVDALPCPPPS